MGTDFYQFNLKTKILFQAGLSKDFGNEISQLQIKKLFLICDPFFVESGVARAVERGIEAAGVRVVGRFDRIPANSELKVVQHCAQLASRSGAEGMVVLGGGSSMDTAKTANILFSLGGDLVADYSGSQTIDRPLKPLIAIPTTAGTGSEVSSAAVILDTEHHAKLSFTDDHLRPDLAILDPELTLSLPPKVTAMTGMDALTHAIESYTSRQANPMSDAMAMKALKLIKNNLLQAVEQGDDLEARSQMLIAANMAGIAFDHAMVGIVHAMSHAAGGVAGVPHGLANHIFLPFGMEYNKKVSARRYAGIARRFGIETAGMDPEEAAQAAIDYVRQIRRDLKKSCGLPDRLREAGIRGDQLEAIAELAMEDGTTYFNPREVTLEGLREKIQEAF